MSVYRASTEGSATHYQGSGYFYFFRAYFGYNYFLAILDRCIVHIAFKNVSINGLLHNFNLNFTTDGCTVLYDPCEK